jgi:hypothetical protein
MTKTKAQPKRKTNRPRNVPMDSVRATAPVAISKHSTTGAPRIQQDSRSTRIRHREYIADVTAAASAFTVRNFALNPGLGGSFPWLADIAGRYESYVFRSLRIHYQPFCPTATPGSLMLAVDYDAKDGAPTGKVEMMAMSHATRCSVWDKTTYVSAPLDLRKFGVQRYVRTSGIPTGTDVKTYDVGNLFVGTANTPTTATSLGEIYIEYDVEFYTPQININTGSRNNEQLLTVTLNPTSANLVSEYVGVPIFAFTATSPSGFADLAINPAISGAYKVMVNGTSPVTDFLGKTPAANKLDFPFKYRAIKSIFGGTSLGDNVNFVIRSDSAPPVNDDANNASMFRLKLPATGTTILRFLITGIAESIYELIRDTAPSLGTNIGPNVLSPLPDFNRIISSSSRNADGRFEQNVVHEHQRDRYGSDASFRSDFTGR